MEQSVSISYPVILREGAWQQDRAQPVPIMLLAAGLSNGQKGRMRYGPEMLMREAHKFENVPVFDNHLSDEEFAKKPYRSVREKLGRVRNVHFDAAQGGLVGDLYVLRETAPWFDDLIHTHPEEVAFSIEARGPVKPLPEKVGGRSCYDVLGFSKVISLDTVVEAGAGGQVLAFRESVSSEEGTHMAELTPEQISQIVQQAVTPLATQLQQMQQAQQELRQQMTLRETAETFFARATQRVQESTLPTTFKDAIMADLRESAVPATLEAGEEILKRKIDRYTALLGSNAAAPQQTSGGAAAPNGGVPGNVPGVQQQQPPQQGGADATLREARERIRGMLDERLGQVWIAGQSAGTDAANPAGQQPGASTQQQGASGTPSPDASTVQAMLGARMGMN